MKTPLKYEFTQISDNEDIVVANDVGEEDAEYIVKACDLYPEFIALLENLNNAETYEFRSYLSDIEELLKRAKHDRDPERERANKG